MSPRSCFKWLKMWWLCLAILQCWHLNWMVNWIPLKSSHLGLNRKNDWKKGKIGRVLGRIQFDSMTPRVSSSSSYWLMVWVRNDSSSDRLTVFISGVQGIPLSTLYTNSGSCVSVTRISRFMSLRESLTGAIMSNNNGYLRPSCEIIPFTTPLCLLCLEQLE